MDQTRTPPPATQEVLSRLLYLGDVPVEASYHGSALLYRLLEKYASSGLTIVETGVASKPNLRLPNARYEWMPLSKERWLNTRFHPIVVTLYSALARRSDPQILNEAQLDGVLTVAHGFGWLAAAQFADSRRLPLHIIVHDDWPRVANVPAAFRPQIERWFATVYRQAQSRIVVSPSMRDAYQRDYGRDAIVLYPIRDPRNPEFSEPPDRLSRNNHTFTAAFAGTINNEGYVETLKTLHSALQSVKGELLIFGPLDQSAAQRIGLNLPGVICKGLLDSTELIQRLRQEADLLFVPMSFAQADAANMKMAFPSKLADYTAAGVPLLIYGPKYCSAVLWAEKNAGAASIVTTQSVAALAKEISMLARSPLQRMALGAAALNVGNKYFSPAQVQSVFDAAIRTRSAKTPVMVRAAC